MSELKVNKVTPRSGTTLTIGDSGDTTNVVGTLQNNGAALVGDISSVVAGTNLSGGGTSGAVTINLADASTSAKGASSFSSDNFAASSGAITIKDLGVATAEIQDDAVTLGKMAPGTDGNIISYDASGNPVAVATGSDGQVLTSTGAGSPPAFEALPSSSLFIKTAGVDISAGGNVILQNCFSSTYTNYFITFERIKNATDGAQCQFTPINSSGATSAEHGYQGLFMGYSQYSNNWSGSNASTYKINENCGNASGEHVSGFLYAFNPNQASASQFSITWQVQANHNGAGGRIGVAWGGGRTATNVSAYTGFKLDYSAGNINSGRIAVYGIVDPT